MSVTLWLEELRDDVKFAFRQLRAAPAFTLVATLTLALGIGANSAIFALVDATLLRPLPYGEPDRLVTIWETSRARRRAASRRRRTCCDWKSRSRTFDDHCRLHAVDGQHGDVGTRRQRADGVAAVGDARASSTCSASSRLPAGRSLPKTKQQRRRSVVISEGLWETRFNRDPSIVGSELKLDGELWTVVGVMPKELRDPRAHVDVGRCVRFRPTCRRARGRPTSCRWSAA